MKLHTRCERCGKYGEVVHSKGPGNFQGQIYTHPTECVFSPPQGWNSIEAKMFCVDCERHIREALDAAMRRTPESYTP